MASDKKTSINVESISIARKKGLFSAAAYELVSSMLNGKVKIHPDDIQLETENDNVSAIFISEQLSCNPDFKKMWNEGVCVVELRKLAQKALEDDI